LPGETEREQQPAGPYQLFPHKASVKIPTGRNLSQCRIMSMTKSRL
jgi:hypothetical protein